MKSCFEWAKAGVEDKMFRIPVKYVNRKRKKNIQIGCIQSLVKAKMLQV